MSKSPLRSTIEEMFLSLVRKLNKPASLLIHSEKLNLHFRLSAENGSVGTDQKEEARYLGSICKLFTATLVAKLVEQNVLAYGDPITRFLDRELIRNLHVYRGHDYSNEILVGHLLSHTSGLGDHFWALYPQLAGSEIRQITIRGAIHWTKKHFTSLWPPGRGFFFSETNYQLAGLIIEQVSGMPAHAAFEKYLFKPAGMPSAYLLTQPHAASGKTPKVPAFCLRGIQGNAIHSLASITFTAGGMVASASECLAFLQSLVSGRLVKRNGLLRMMREKHNYSPGFSYGYGIMRLKQIPLFIPKKLYAWGHTAETGSFLFYHPSTESFIIGLFNDCRCEREALRFLVYKLLRTLARPNN